MKRFWMLALIALLLIAGAANAETDGSLRVKLKSLGERKRICVNIEGEYLLGGEALEGGANLEFTAQNGFLWANDGTASVRLGKQARLERLSGGLYIAESEKNARYDGSLSLSARGNAITCILNIGIEDYLCGVVGYEMSDSFPIEALKAQAVAARTYAMRAKARSGEREYDLVDTAGDQVFKGRNDAYRNVLAAVEQTRGAVGMVNGRFAECYYTASNGGRIAAPEEIWGGESDGAILAHDDSYDLENPRSLVSAIAFRMDLSDCSRLKEMLAEKLNGSAPVCVLNAEIDGQAAKFIVVAMEKTESGAPILECIRTLSIQTAELDVYDDLKRGLSIGLNRRDYERAIIRRDGAKFSLELRGFGHCAGMSQRGAEWMAKAYARDYREILAFYYPGMTLETLEWAPQTPEISVQTEKNATVTLKNADSSLNLRAEPSMDAAVIGKIRSGTKIHCGTEQNGWREVRIYGVQGWIKAEYAKP